ncbi:MAG: carbohydrate-binding domain-containing protein [Bacteroidales bacterium]|nr:carbohydrate-binding domain-containing protein [Bacteroidales bacterium]
MMKKLFVSLLAIVASSMLMAQNYEMRVMHNGANIFSQPVSAADSIKFNNSTATINYGQLNWSRNLAQLDSIIFAAIPNEDSLQVDTTAIDTLGAIRIHWADTGVSVVNGFADAGVAVSVSGSHVVVNSSSSESDLVYLLSGSCPDGALEITSGKKLILCLDGLSLTHTDGPAINMLSDKRVLLHMMSGTANTLSDGPASAGKGAIQFKGKLDIQGSGTLNIHGLAKHGIQSSGKCNMIWGTVNVLSAVKDGFNVDDFVMDGGRVSVTSSGDGIDGDKGFVQINHGTIVVNCSSPDVKGIGCDSTLTIYGGNITVNCTGNQSKCFKSADTISIYGGTIVLNALGSVVLEESGSGYDPAYCTAIKGDANFYYHGGNTTILCADTNAGGKGVSVKGSVFLNGGVLNITALGACAAYTNEDGIPDSYYSACIKSDAHVFVNGGTYTFSAGGRAITCDSNYHQLGGHLTLSTNANGAVLVGSGTSATDGYSAACLKADESVTVLGGIITARSTGLGGRGIAAKNLTIGQLGDNDDKVDINVYTSGSPVNASSSGGGWGGPGHGSSTDYWKGLPKGIKIDSTIIINSGHVSVYCSQTSGDPNGEAIESKGDIIIRGGEVEANSYDDAINAARSIEISGGKVWAYARGNDAIDCNGTAITISGGLVVVKGSEVGIDADTENGGRFNISGGTIVCVGGNMGAWDTPTCTGSQRYIIPNVSTTNGICVKSSDGSEMLVFMLPTVSGSGFIDQTDGTGTKPPPGGGGSGGNSGVGISLPGMTAGTYTVFTNVTITGGSCWHGFYTGATCATTGAGTSATTR